LGLIYTIAQIEWRKNAIIGAGEINAKSKKTIKACKNKKIDQQRIKRL
jgi:hypothetical protein